MDDLIAILIAAVFIVAFYLFVKARERRERDPGISLFGGEPTDPPPSEERRHPQ
jgi:hypothetical protein